MENNTKPPTEKSNNSRNRRRYRNNENRQNAQTVASDKPSNIKPVPVKPTSPKLSNVKAPKAVVHPTGKNCSPRDKSKEKERHHRNEKNLKWEFEPELRPAQLPETKADLMNILADINPEELLMEPLVQKKKIIAKPVKQEETLELNPEIIIENDMENQSSKTKTVIDLTKECPICQKNIREIMYALHDYEHDQLAHFDCVYKKVTNSVKEKLINGRYISYLGSGSFGIMEPKKGKNSGAVTLIEKIYPGAPVEELLHGSAETIDEEI